MSNNIRLQNIIIYNRAPFEKLNLTLENNNIVVVSGINGTGKTTIMSYIVDSLYELAKKAYHNEFEGKEKKFYRVSADIFTLDSSKASIVYLRYVDDDNNYYDYVDYRGNSNPDLYDSIVCLSNKIPFDNLTKHLNEGLVSKVWSITEKKRIITFFENNILTYFPSYRYEKPLFLADSYQIDVSFKKEDSFSGYLTNPIEVTSDLPQIANWIMDIALDSRLYDGQNIKEILSQINNIISNILFPKLKCKTRVGIGPRSSGAGRIAIMNVESGRGQIYPSIFNMSSGELALLCLFGEILKQADSIGKNASDAFGIVLVDEIDKHLHISLQKDILPRLIRMFPNVQFIVTSHSPFLGLGLSDDKELSYTIYDLDNNGIACPPQDNELFIEVYNMMINQNEQYFSRYKQVQETIQNNTKPLVITEGKTDWKHLKAAVKKLEIQDFDVEIYEYDDVLGDSKLKQMLLGIANIKQPRKIIGIFDRDNFEDLKWKELESLEYLSIKNEVYAFAIPMVNTEEYGERISIEHYYKREDLTREDSNGRRIFLGDEFFDTGLGKDSNYYTRCKGFDKKIKVNGVIDEKVYDKNTDLEGKKSIALSKNDFAELILNNEEFTKNIDFSAFEKIIEIIKKIVKDNTDFIED